MRYKLHIIGPDETRSVDVTDRVSIGRTGVADVALDDPGLSRINTTFLIRDGELFAVDEDSTNGTFLDGESIGRVPRALRHGDLLKLGSGTTVRVEIADEILPTASSEQPARSPEMPITVPPPKPVNAGGAPWLIAASAGMTLLILVFGGVGIYLLLQMNSNGPSAAPGSTRAVTASAVIPVRVIDPLGGEDEEELDDLIASWEVAEEEINASDVADIAVSSSDAEESELNVSAAFLADRQRLALADRPGDKGIRPAGLSVPRELFGDGVIKQKQKLAQMNSGGYRQPMDFADLAAKRLNRELIEMPMAAQSFYLDVGGSAQDGPFTSFAFPNERSEIAGGHPKYDTLRRLAENFAGQRYDLSDSSHRKQVRRRLLRMFHPRARPILKEIADAYFSRFGRPLRVTSLTRSMDYQILLNANNPNSFKVRGEGSLPPHTSGCAFDLARKHMPAEEQNFVMAKLAEMERAGKLDALIEYGANACFHVFIYPDGVPPRASNLSAFDAPAFPFLASISLRDNRP